MPLGLCIRNAKKKQIDDMKDKKNVPAAVLDIEVILQLMN